MRVSSLADGVSPATRTRTCRQIFCCRAQLGVSSTCMRRQKQVLKRRRELFCAKRKRKSARRLIINELIIFHVSTCTVNSHYRMLGSWYRRVNEKQLTDRLSSIIVDSSLGWSWFSHILRKIIARSITMRRCCVKSLWELNWAHNSRNFPKKGAQQNEISWKTESQWVRQHECEEDPIYSFIDSRLAWCVTKLHGW